MEPTSSVDDDAEFHLPPEFLTDDDFLVEKENNLFKGDYQSSLFPYELSRHGFGLDSGFSSTVKPTREDDCSGGFRGSHAFPSGKVCTTTRSPPPPRGAGIGCGRRSQNSQAEACDLYCAALEEMAMMNINIPNAGGTGYYSRQSLQYQKLQALQFQQLKQQQLMKRPVQQSRGLKANSNNKVAGGHVGLLSSSAWSNQQLHRRDGSGMRAVFLGGDRTGKPRSTGTGVFLPRGVNHTLETREKPPSFATVLIPARVAEVLNLDESVVQPSVRSSASLTNDVSWRQRRNNGGFSSQMKMEQTVIEPRLPSDWAY